MHTNPAPVSRRQLSDQATAHLRALIMSGALAPGESVRPEVVGAQLGISTTPAREALQLLRAEGFLELAPGRGFTVAPLTGDDVRDLFAVQALIAGELAARAVKAMSDSTFAELEALHLELVSAAQRGDTAGLEQMNHEFHRYINCLAGSRKVLWALTLVARYVPRKFYGSIPGWPDASVDDHGELLAAFKVRDAHRARVAMQSHITHAGELLAAHFDSGISG